MFPFGKKLESWRCICCCCPKDVEEVAGADCVVCGLVAIGKLVSWRLEDADAEDAYSRGVNVAAASLRGR